MIQHSIDKNPETKYEHPSTCKASSTVKLQQKIERVNELSARGRSTKRDRASQIVV